PEKWRALWATVEGDSIVRVGNSQPMTTQRRIPDVDFAKNVVIGVFGGPSGNVERYEVIGASGLGEKAFVRFRPVVTPGAAAVMMRSPYLLVLVPRTRKEIEVQVQTGLRAGRPEFRTVASIPKTLSEAVQKEQGQAADPRK
ncbi:MAG TPA: hypothetical protein VGE01_13845, partial [Fimbriimonas sp.]